MVSSGQTYLITNKKAGTACDLSGQDQKSVIGFTTQRSDNQKVRLSPASFSGADPDLSAQWRVQDTGNGWTVQNMFNQKYLDVEGPLQDGTKVVAVETANPRTWDIRPDQRDSNAYR